jgi:hypothetical protein
VIKKDPRVLRIPEDKVAEFWQLYDASVSSNESNVLRYALWKFLKEIFPELNEGGDWKIHTKSILFPCLVERVE